VTERSEVQLARQGGAVAVAVVLLAAGCVAPTARWVAPTSGRVTSPSAAPSTSGGASIGPARWTPCPDVWQGTFEQAPPNVTFDCATVNVPQDWTAPANGKTFGIAIVRGRTTGQRDRVGSLLINPGGPGASGIDYAVYRSVFLPAEITRRFDVIGFDPRGVGKSAPVKCFSDGDLDANFGADPDPAADKDFNGAVALSRRLAQECGDKYGESLRLFSTEQTARDMDAIRIAVGDRQLSYLGYSYGTLLGAVYAELFPTNVRALVLDGAVDPTVSSEAAAEEQAIGFERAFSNFTTWCKSNADKCPIAPDARAAVVAALQTARSSPVQEKGRTATAGWVFTAVVSSLYSESSWRLLASAMDNLRKGQPSDMFGLADAYADRDSAGHYSNLFDANAAINCTDDDQTTSIDHLRALQSAWRAKYPLFGAPMALNLICAQWPGKHDPFPAGRAVGAPPIVVVGTIGDPATPYEQAGALAKMLGAGTVVTWQGQGHTAYPKTRCVTDAVNRYLIDLKVPATGMTCPP
jgi:pimeloyl-ACP methyl ester carboxylesterase